MKDCISGPAKDAVQHTLYICIDTGLHTYIHTQEYTKTRIERVTKRRKTRDGMVLCCRLLSYRLSSHFSSCVSVYHQVLCVPLLSISLPSYTHLRLSVPLSLFCLPVHCIISSGFQTSHKQHTVQHIYFSVSIIIIGRPQTASSDHALRDRRALSEDAGKVLSDRRSLYRCLSLPLLSHINHLTSLHLFLSLTLSSLRDHSPNSCDSIMVE